MFDIFFFSENRIIIERKREQREGERGKKIEKAIEKNYVKIVWKSFKLYGGIIWYDAKESPINGIGFFVLEKRSLSILSDVIRIKVAFSPFYVAPFTKWCITLMHIHGKRESIWILRIFQMKLFFSCSSKVMGCVKIYYTYCVFYIYVIHTYT